MENFVKIYNNIAKLLKDTDYIAITNANYTDYNEDDEEYKVFKKIKHMTNDEVSNLGDHCMGHRIFIVNTKITEYKDDYYGHKLYYGPLITFWQDYEDWDHYEIAQELTAKKYNTIQINCLDFNNYKAINNYIKNNLISDLNELSNQSEKLETFVNNINVTKIKTKYMEENE